MGNTVSFGGVTLGQLDSNGVFWVWVDIDGWGPTKSTAQFTQRGRGDGGFASEAFREYRTFTVMGTIIAPTDALLLAAVDQLSAAASITQQQVTVVDAGVSRFVWAQRQDEPLISRTSPVSVDFTVQFVATDPRKFGAPVTQSTSLPSSTGGLTWPVTWPAVWSATQVTGVITINNPGNTTGKVTMRISGAVTGASVTHLGTGQALTFASSSSVASGNWLDVDMDAKTVLENGQASRAGWVTSRGWFGLEPGVNQFAFNAPTFSGSAQLSVTGTPAWL